MQECRARDTVRQGNGLFSSPGFPGEGDHAQHGGGASWERKQKSPSTALRAVPLPSKSRGGEVPPLARCPPPVLRPIRLSPKDAPCTSTAATSSPLPPPPASPPLGPSPLSRRSIRSSP